MNGYEIIEFLSRVVALAANVIVAGVCFGQFQEIHLRPLLILAISATLGAFTLFAELLLLRNLVDESGYTFVWTGVVVLGIVDLILYAWGVTQLVKWIGRQKPGERERAEEQ